MGYLEYLELMLSLGALLSPVCSHVGVSATPHHDQGIGLAKIAAVLPCSRLHLLFSAADQL